MNDTTLTATNPQLVIFVMALLTLGGRIKAARALGAHLIDLGWTPAQITHAATNLASTIILATTVEVDPGMDKIGDQIAAMFMNEMTEKLGNMGQGSE